MYPTLFNFIPTYSLMLLVGIAASIALLEIYFRYHQLDKKLLTAVELAGTISLLSGLLFALLFQNLYDFLEDPSSYSWSNSYTFYGGLLGGVGVFSLFHCFYLRKYQDALSHILTIAPSSICIGHAFGRLGCFFNGCCYGIETDSFWGIKFPNLENPVYPTQLFEMAFLFLLGGILFFLALKKEKFLYLTPFYCLCYGLFRFLLEYIRGDDRGAFIPGLTPSQFWSLLLLAIGLLLLIYFNFIRLKADPEETQQIDGHQEADEEVC